MTIENKSELLAFLVIAITILSIGAWTASIEKQSMQEDAVAAGHAEYYQTKSGARQWRWLSVEVHHNE